MLDSQLFSRAQNGDAEAQYQMGVYYSSPQNADIDPGEAYQWYLKAATAGHATAQNKLANMLINGRWIQQDVEKALYWYGESAKQGNAAAQYNLGRVYYSGNHVSKDIEKAVFWLEKAAEQGDADAYYYLGWCYRFEKAIPADPERAAAMWQKASDLGHAPSMLQLGLIYYYDEENAENAEIAEIAEIAENEKKAFDLFEKSSLLGNKTAMMYLGHCYKGGYGVLPDASQALEWYSQSAAQGYNEAQYYLGECYYNGDGVEKDIDKALAWFEQAATNGSNQAYYKLGLEYVSGTNIQADLEKGTAYLRTAAESGYGKAQYELGRFYSKGLHLPQDEQEALHWLRQAAENEVPPAQIFLGLAYRKGTIGEKDNGQAMFWFQKALENEPYNASLMAEIGGVFQDDMMLEEAIEYFVKSAELGSLPGAVSAALNYCLQGNMIQAAITTDITTDQPSSMALECFQNARKWSDFVLNSEADQELKNICQEYIPDIDLGLGFHYFQEGDREKAAPYLQKASSAGKVFANVLLAHYAMDSTDATEESRREAYVTTKTALDSEQLTLAQRGFCDYFLAEMYQAGRGVAPSTDAAYAHAKASADAGCPAGESLLQKYQKKTTGGYE